MMLKNILNGKGYNSKSFANGKYGMIMQAIKVNILATNKYLEGLLLKNK